MPSTAEPPDHPPFGEHTRAQVGTALRIGTMVEHDWAAVRRIYLEGIATGQATFETGAPGYEAWDRAHLPACRLVAESDGRVVGWAALSTVSDRCVYEGVAEVSIYVAAGERGKGIGLWLHTSAGFRVVGLRRRLGCMNGTWRDVIDMEKRSEVVGI